MLKGWTFIHTYGIINPFLHRNEMLTDEVNCHGLAIINITRCFTERVSGRSRCNVNRNTRDSLPWFFFILLFIRTKVPGSSVFFFILWANFLNACWIRASILRKEDRRVSHELTAHSHVKLMVHDF